MTKSIYVLGAAGAGKSTFTAELLQDRKFGPLEDLMSLKNAKALVTLRGHQIDNGMYLGVHRDQFPGSDGLDRASSPVGEAWLQAGDLPDWIISEGATLATRRFLKALNRHTELLLVYLQVDPVIADLRFLQRGSNQDPKFVLNTVTRSANLVDYMHQQETQILFVDTGDSNGWIYALQKCSEFLFTSRRSRLQCTKRKEPECKL